MKTSCDFCSKTEIINNMSGKEFFVNLPKTISKNAGNLCLAIDSRGKHVLHYEHASHCEISMLDCEIEFCPKCGRRLSDEED